MSVKARRIEVRECIYCPFYSSENHGFSFEERCGWLTETDRIRDGEINPPVGGIDKSCPLKDGALSVALKEKE